MNIDVWQAGALLAAAVALAWGGSRWWHLRQVRSLSRRLAKLGDTHQSTLQMMNQARRQNDDLQRMLTEYRRRLTTLELAKRRAEAPPPASPASGSTGSTAKTAAKTAATAAEAPALPPMRLQGGWADTQPM